MKYSTFSSVKSMALNVASGSIIYEQIKNSSKLKRFIIGILNMHKHDGDKIGMAWS